MFLRYSEEFHFLLIASICFYTHSETAAPGKEAGRVQGQAREEPVSRGAETCGQCFDGRREEMFTTAPNEFPPPHTLPSEAGPGRQENTQFRA